MDDQDRVILSVYPHTWVQVLKEGVDFVLPGGDQHSPVRKELAFPNCKVTLHSEENGRLERVSIQEIEIPDLTDELPPL